MSSCDCDERLLSALENTELKAATRYISPETQYRTHTRRSLRRDLEGKERRNGAEKMEMERQRLERQTGLHYTVYMLRTFACQAINQSINLYRAHSTEARATVRLCGIKEKCLKTDLKCVNGWSSLTVQWKRVLKSRSSNRQTTSSSVQVVRPN